MHRQGKFPPEEGEGMDKRFSEETIRFFWELQFNNDRDWFQAHKQQYTDHVLTPLRQLAEEVFDRFLEEHSDLPLTLRVSRIYRDARRLHGKGPYKKSMWFTFRTAGEDWSRQPAFWFEVRAEGYNYGMGIYSAAPATMARFRREIDQHPETIRKLAQAFAQQERFVLEGECYKRPKGTPPAPLDQWYNRKSINLCSYHPVDQQLYSQDLAETLLEGFTALLPYYNYFQALCARGD